MLLILYMFDLSALYTFLVFATFRFFLLSKLWLFLLLIVDSKTKKKQEEIIYIKYSISFRCMTSLYPKLKLFFGAKRCKRHLGAII